MTSGGRLRRHRDVAPARPYGSDAVDFCAVSVSPAAGEESPAPAAREVQPHQEGRVKAETGDRVPTPGPARRQDRPGLARRDPLDARRHPAAVDNRHAGYRCSGNHLTVVAWG